MNSERTKLHSRLEGLDLARFIALAGMVFVNFDVVMVGPDPTGSVHFGLAQALQGRAAATFVVLAGIGLGLGAARAGWNESAAVTLKRSGFLLCVGLLNLLIFDADIIHYYAFYFLFGVVLLRAPAWLLLLAMTGLTAGFVALVVALDYDAGWNWQTFTYSGFWTAKGFARNLFFNGWHPVVPWLAFFLFGILLSRLNLGGRGVQLRLAVGGAAVLVLATAGSNALMALVCAVDEEAAVLFASEPMPPMPLYMLAGGGAACAVAGLCLLVARPFESIGLLRICTAPGRQTLTLYLAHIVIGMGTLEALGMIGGQSPRSALVAAALFTAIATVYAVVWSRFFQRGPLETLMRKVTG